MAFISHLKDGDISRNVGPDFFFKCGPLFSAPTLTCVVFLYNVLLKIITSIRCLFTLFLDPSQFLLDNEICQIPNLGMG